MSITILPAIDMKDGRCVRLRQGRADDETIYDDSPLEMAKRWCAEGAEYLHLVDLSGAFEAKPVHDEIVLTIAKIVGIPVEIGGGIRTTEQIECYLSGGVDRVIIGTRACETPDILKAWVDQFGAGIVVGIDARDGFVQTKGWTETSTIKAVDLAQQMDAIGVQTLIYTDTARDGMMAGVNDQAMGALCDAVSCPVIASGGVTVADDVRKLNALNRSNLQGVIVGKALYEGTVNLKELLCI